MANPLLTDEQNRRLANQNSTYNQIMQGFAPAQQPQEDSWLGGLSRGAKAGLGGVGAGLLHAGQAAFGTDGSLAAGFDAMAKNNAQRREWDLADTLSLDYLTNPEGLAYGLGQLAGSMALPALFGAGVAAAVPTGGTSLLGTGALIGAAGAAPMAISEGGNTYAQGLQQGMTEDEAKKAGLTDAAIKLPFYMLSEGLSGKVAQGLISKGLLNAEGKSLGRRAAESGAKILGNAANEAYEEGTENRSSAYALGDQRISSLGNIFNPFDWNDEDKAQAVGVFTPTLALGALTGGAGHLRSRFDKKNSDVSEEIASEDGGTIEEAPEANVSGREAFINAIAGQESGGNYNAENGDTGAYGKYQIMPSNWPEWAEEAGIGADAPRTPENQEIVARFKLGQYYDKYGARGAAIAWYGGEGALNYSDEALNRKQGDNGEYPSINEYADEVLGRMGNVADSARIDDTEENYFDESDSMGLPKLSTPTAKGFDVSHLVDEETQDARELFGEKQDENIGKQNLGNDFFSNIKVEQDKRAKAIKDIARAVSQPNTFDELRNSIPSNYLEQMQKARAVVPVNNNAVGRPIPPQTGAALTMQRGRNGGLNTDELAIMQKYQGNPDAFNRQLKKSVEAVRDAVNRGDITPDVGRAYMQNLGNMYNTVAGTVQNDGVILQGQDPAIIKMLGNLRDKRRRGDTGALPSLLQENGNVDRSAAFANKNNPLAPLNLPVRTQKEWDKAEAEYKARAEEKAEKHTRQQAIADILNGRAAQKWDEAENTNTSTVEKGIDIALPEGVTAEAKSVTNKKTGKKEVELKFSGKKISDEFKKKLRAHGFNWNVGRKAWVAEENIVTKAVAEKLTQKDNGEVKEGNQTEKTTELAQDKADSVQMKRTQAKQAIDDAPKGKTVEATTDNGVKFDVQYAIVPADSLITSNNASDFSNNEAYPQELQPRDRNRAYMRLQVEKMSGAIEPERITTGTSVNEGAPVVNKDGVVENGNGRTMALVRMWRSGNKKLQKAYRDYLIKNAVKFGLLSSSIKGISNPILVRIHTDNNVSVSEVTDSTKGGAQLSTAEQALQDSKKLKDSTLAKYEQNRLGTIDNAKNAEFVRAVFKDIIPEDELNAYTTTDGSLSKSGRQRAVNAILAKAYGADPVLFNLVESTDEAYGKIGDALIAAAPTIAKLKALASNQTLFDVDLAGEILKAIEFVSNAKANNMAVFDAVSQQSMFADYNVDELTKKLALFIDNNKGAKWKNIVDMVTVSADVIAKKGSPLQGNVFGEEVKVPTAEEVLTTAINRVTNGEATAIIRMNDEKGQIEIKFVGNVSESVKKKLAKAKYKLSLEEQMWHADRNAASMKVAKELGYEEQGGNNGSISIFDEEAQAERNAGETASAESNETEEKQPTESNQDEVKETAEQPTKKSFFQKRNEQAVKEQLPQNNGETAQGEKLNLPKGTTADVSIVGDNSNIIQVKFNGEQGKGTGGIMGRAGYVWKKDKQVWQARKTDKAMEVAEQLGYKPTEEMSEDKIQQTDKYKNYSKEDIKINKERLATMPDVDGILQPAAKKFAEFFKAHFPESDYTYEAVDVWNNYTLEFEQLNKILKKYRKAVQQGNLSMADAYFQQISSSFDRINDLLEKLVGNDKEMRQEFVDSITPVFDEYHKIVDEHNAKDNAKKTSKAKKQQGKQEYKYYLNARPADIGAVPKGFIRVDAEDKGGRYGAIYYDRQLNDTDVQQYELKSADDVEKEKAQKEALETVSKELLKSDKLKAQAKNNSIGDFVLAYRDAVDDYLVEHVDENPAYTKLLNNPEIADEFLESESIVEKAYDKLKASDNSQDVVQSNKGNTNEGGNNNGIDITGNLSSNDTGSRRAENEIRTTSTSEESSGSNGQGSRALERQSGRNGNNGVSGSRTAAGGKTSISKGSEQASAVRENPARSAELSRSVVDSLQEQPNVDEGATDKIVESVADGRTDAADTVSQKVNEVVKENKLDKQRADRLRKTAKVMPFLSKIQFSNTDFVADRLADNGKQGVMITDGTGTGKTFSGLAVAKEMVEDGKENILIVTPSDSVNNQWANAAKDFFGIELSKLDNIQDAGQGAVITTYANLGANDALIKRDWDLVICDESHYLMNNEQGEKTAALAKLRQLTLHPRELRARAEERILPEEKLEARRTIAQAAKLKRKKGQLKASEEAIVEKAEKLQKEKADELSKEERAQVEAQVKDWEQLNATEKPKVMFMSATPFAYVPDIDYAEGYLFDYPKVEGGSYNQPGNGFQQFMIEHFGYHMRYNKLTKPDKAVDNAVMEVEFHEWLRKTGALTGHELEIDKDYNRGFLLVDQGVGKKIDEGFEFLRNNHDKYRELEGVFNKQFDSRRRNYLLESIKARESVPIIQQYLKAGKKVVVFYETNVERESFNPFKFTQQTKELLQSGENRWASEEIQREMEMFAKERPDLVNLNLDELSEPISIYREAFGDDAMFFNGRVSKNKRAEYVKAFNDDNSGKNLIFVQQDAGNAGISLHDTTGKHQRVLINIGIPRRPSYAIQIEGRIYRLGNKSNAIIRYLTTATNIENGLFADTVAGRASTAENLALGRRARGLRDSFKNAYQEIFDGTWEDRSPGTEGEDIGGKENDRNIVSTDSDYDRAKAFYFARGKKTAKNKAAEGVDYFATPEPVGYKMVQWAGLKDGDRVLEPSAGHGAISRFFSPNTDNTIIEPSSRLAPQAQMNTDNAKLINGYFEDLHIGNKYDAVTMNPPFGTGGKTAVEHVAKAFKHLRNGGRVIAIIPRGAMADKRFNTWYESDDAKDAHMVGEVLLPDVTFERAGTKVATRVIIIDKGGEAQGIKRIDLSSVTDINELFNQLENIEMPERHSSSMVDRTMSATESTRGSNSDETGTHEELVSAGTYKHTKTGELIPYATLKKSLSSEEYAKAKKIASSNNGFYSKFAKGFLFKTEESRDAFVNELNKSSEQTGDAQYSVSEEASTRSREEVEAEIKKALPGAELEQQSDGNYITTMPNGKRLGIVIEDQILLNERQAEKAGKAHNRAASEAEGYWSRWEQLDGKNIDGVIRVSRNSRVGTAFHETLHAAMDLCLTEKEKAALYKAFAKKAKESGRSVDEEIADAYKEWAIKRQNGQGSMFGKLFQKAKDFLNKLYTMFVEANNKGNIFRKLESGEAWKQQGERSSKDAQYAVTNNAITGETLVPIVDVSGLSKADISKTALQSNIARGLIGKTFRIIGSNGIGKVANVKDGKHLLNSSKVRSRNESARLKTLTAIDDVLNNAVYVEKHSDERHGSNDKYIELYAVVKNNDNLFRFRIVAKEGDKQAGDYEVKIAKFYDIIKDGKVTANAQSALPAIIPDGMKGQVRGTLPSTISVAKLLAGVKGRDGKLLVNKNGGLNYNSEIFKGIKKEAATTKRHADEISPQYTSETGSGNTASVSDTVSSNSQEVKYSVAPSQNKIANAFTNTERKGTIETAKDFIKEGFKDFRAHWLDKNDNLRKFDEITQMTGEMSIHQNVQNIPATAAGLLKSVCEGDAQSIKAANQHLKNVKMKHNVTLAMALNEINKDVMDKAHPKYLEANGFDSWQNAFGAYLGVERELEMSSIAKAQGETYKFSKGLTEAECRNFVANAPVQFRKAADMFYKVNDNVISIMEDAQVFSHDVAKALRTKHRKYCPLLRDFSDTAAADNFIGGLSAGGRGVGNVSIPLKAISIKGSERGVLNPLETVLKSYAMMINRAERNKVGLLAVKAAQTKQLHDLIKEVPEVVGKDGKVVNAVADPKNCIFTVLVNGKKKAYQTTQELYSPIVGYNLPAAGLTLEVARMTAQMLRTGATMSPSFIIRNLLRDTITAGFSSKNGFIPFVDTWRGFMALKNDPVLRAEFEAAGVGEFNFYGAKAQRIKSLDKMIGEHENLFKRIFGKMEEWSDIAESATRMGEFMLARKAGKSLEQAGHEAREVTVDFSKSGIYGEQINRYIPFFNACLQGGDKIYQLMREDPHGTMMKMFLTIVLPSALLYAFNRDEDWWKDLDPDIKNNYWCLSDKLRIPKPQEIGVLLGSGIEAFFEQASGRDKKAVSNVLDAFLDNMTPSIIPTLILPLVEWKTNYSYFRGQQLVSSKYQRLPDELQYNDYTSELSKGIGNVFKVSPMKVDNLVRGYTGTMGALLWGAAGEPFAKANNLPAKHFNEMLFVRDFNVTDANLSRPMNEFYGILDKANRQHAGYGVKGKPEAAVKGIRSAGSMISKIRKDIDKITHSNLTPERKRELIDKRKEKMNQIAKQANARYGKYFE